MRIEAYLFAILRERAGCESVSLDLPAGSRVDEALAAIALRVPAIAPLVSRVQVAVNRAFVGQKHTLCDGDEVVLIPPVAGGAGAPSRRITISASALDPK